MEWLPAQHQRHRGFTQRSDHLRNGQAGPPHPRPHVFRVSAPRPRRHHPPPPPASAARVPYLVVLALEARHSCPSTSPDDGEQEKYCAAACCDPFQAVRIPPICSIVSFCSCSFCIPQNPLFYRFPYGGSICGIRFFIPVVSRYFHSAFHISSAFISCSSPKIRITNTM